MFFSVLVCISPIPPHTQQKKNGENKTPEQFFLQKKKVAIYVYTIKMPELSSINTTQP